MSATDDTPLQSSPSVATPGEHAPWFGELNQRDFEVAFYQRVLHRQPNNVRMLRLLGELYARQGQHARALEIDQKLIELLPEDPIVRYNFACSLAMQGDQQYAIEELARAIELGYNDFSHLEVDPDLESLRCLPQFAALLRKYGLEN